MNMKVSTEGISAEMPNWSREEKSFFSWAPSRSLLASIRSYQRNSNSRNPLRIFVKKWAVLRHMFWSVVTGADIPLNSQIEGGLLMPHVISVGPPVSIESAINALGEFGFHGASDRVEGAVWRIERKGEVDFLCKFVRPDKKDGCYLPELSNAEPVWNWRPDW